MTQQPSLTIRARELRKNQTPAERILWRELLGRRFVGFKFRRQHVVGGFILDLYCAKLGLGIELDGETHLGTEAHDKWREHRLEEHDLTILRFWNTELFDDRETVLESIWQTCQRLQELRTLQAEARCPSPPTPLPEYRERGEGRPETSPDNGSE